MGKKPSHESKEPSYQLSLRLVLGFVLAQFLRASRQVVLETHLWSAQPPPHASQSSLPETC